MQLPSRQPARDVRDFIRDAKWRLLVMKERSGGRLRSHVTYNIDELPSRALRVRACSGTDPISKRRMYLTEVVPPVPKAGDQAERVRARLVTRSTRSAIRAPEPPSASCSTDGFKSSMSIRRPDGPIWATSATTSGPRSDPSRGLGSTSKLWTPSAELRRCREHCDGRPLLQHTTSRPHALPST